MNTKETGYMSYVITWLFVFILFQYIYVENGSKFEQWGPNAKGNMEGFLGLCQLMVAIYLYRSFEVYRKNKRHKKKLDKKRKSTNSEHRKQQNELT